MSNKVNNKTKKRWKIVGGIVILIVLGLGIGFYSYVNDYEKANEEAVAAMADTALVTVTETEDYISYQPKVDSKYGFVFYPGAKVEPTAYSSLFQKLGEQGIHTIVVKMPFNLAMFNINGADQVLEAFEYEQWYLGGHSLGGVFATEYLQDHLEDFAGMIYLASYPSSDLSKAEIPVLSITGELDTVINQEALKNAVKLLPDNTKFEEIEGGNHSQFGSYGLQKKDTPATITAEAQQVIIATKILEFMKN